MNTCSTSVGDKRAFGQAVGNELLRRHGKRSSYMPKQIERAVERAGFPIDVSCWAMSLYSSRENFNEHHAATGEVCDYAAMKSEMVLAMTDGASSSWFDIDMSSIFDFIDFSP
jgi:hypothetical protein